jgi:hypothetical protein
MTNALFTSFKALLLNPGTLGTTSGDAVDLIDDNLKCVLVDHGVDTPVPATDDFLDDIGAGARIATSGNLASKSVTAGVFDAADVTFTAVTGATVESVVIYKDTGTAGTSSLIAFYDTGTGLPVTPNGGDITVVWSSGASKIFAL